MNFLTTTLRQLSIAGAVAMLLLIMPQTARATDPGRELTTPTGWTYYYGQTPAQISNLITTQNQRLVTLKRDGTGTFTITTVTNSGQYARAWWWYYNVTAQQVTDALNTNNARITSIDVYDNGAGSPRFNVVMLHNTGPGATSWWWYYNATTQQISDALSQNAARLIDLHRYTIAGQTRYAAVMIPNSGPGAVQWFWYTNATPAFISQQLQQNNQRIIDIQVNSTDLANPTFDVVMARNQGQKWWWFYGVSQTQLDELISQRGSRIFDYQRYSIPLLGTRYVVLMLDNVNTLTGDIRDILLSTTDGASGLYLRRLPRPGLAGATLAALQHNRQFEPASSIKAIHHAYAMRRVELGLIGLGASIPVYTGSTGSCPQDTGLIFEPLSEVCRKTMENSDNNRTQALRAFFGESNLNNFAQSLGMTNSLLQHRIGCGGEAVVNPNRFTLVDAGRLYEAVATTLLPTRRYTFYSLMPRSFTGYPGFGPAANRLNPIIVQEAASAGLTTAQRNQFIAETRIAFKAGGYTLNNQHYTIINGWLQLPFKSGSQPVPREYVTGVFVEKASDLTNAGNAVSLAASELLRLEIRAAMTTWRTHCFANCDNSTQQPAINVDDFTCFINSFAQAQSLTFQQQVVSYANCDGSTTPPVLNVDDFTCFINAFAAGCP